MSKESKIILSIVAIVLVGIAGLVAFVNGSGSSDSAVMSEKLVREGSHKLGTGEVQVVEFGDYQCPACAQAHPVVQKLVKDYQGKITFVFRNFPLQQIHRNAIPAAQAAEAAAEQGKFWEMHDKLYENQQVWSAMADPTDTFVKYASEIGIDKAKFKKDITEKVNEERISNDQTDGYSVGVSGTPSFFVNGELQREFDYDSLKNAIEAELN